MSRSVKRARGFPDYMEDDPEDESYGSHGSPRKKQKHSAPTKRSKPAKKRRKPDDDDLDEDEDDFSEEDEEDISEVSEEETPVSRTATGRPARSSAVSTKYKEVDTDEDIEAKDEIENSEDEPPRRQKSRRPERKSLIIKLKTGAAGATSRSTRGRSRTGSKGVKPPEAQGMRRSSRISHDDAEQLVSLTDSGRHEKVVRAGSATPEPSSSVRPTRAGKRPPAPTTSTVIEASFEDSQELRPEMEPFTQQTMFTQNEDVVDDPEQVRCLCSCCLRCKTDSASVHSLMMTRKLPTMPIRRKA